MATQLRRSLGLLDVVLFFVIAASNLQWTATAAAAGPSSLPVWLIGAFAMFLPLSVCVVHLSSQYPEEGGFYVWSKRAFGPFAGFITGWTYWMSNLPYFPALLYFLAGNALFMMHGPRGLADSPLYFIAASLAGLAIGTYLNVLGLDVAKWLNNVGAASRWIVILLLMACGGYAIVRFGPATPLNWHAMRPGMRMKDIIFWSTIAFAWTGPEAISLMCGEVKDPRRTIARGLLLAAPVIFGVYVVGTASVLAALPAASVNPLYGVMQAIGQIGDRAGVGGLAPIAAALVALSCLGSVGAWLGAAARLPFVAGIDRYLPAAFGRIHPGSGAPVVALVTQAVITVAFIFLGQGGSSVKGAYEILVSTTVIATLLPFGFIFASALVLPSTGAAGAIPIPGGRATIVASALVGLFTTVSAIAIALLPPPDEPNAAFAVLKVVGMNVVLVGSGVAVYLAGTRRALRDRRARYDERNGQPVKDAMRDDRVDKVVGRSGRL